MAIHSSILAWRIPRTEERGELQSMGSQRVGHNWTTTLSFFLLLQLFITMKTKINLSAHQCGAGHLFIQQTFLEQALSHRHCARYQKYTVKCRKKGIYVSINRWMDREDVKCVYMSVYNGILLSHKKEWNIAICNNMDRPRMYHIEWSKPKTNIIWLISGI